MPEVNVQKSAVIRAGLDRVYASVRSFRDWVHWFPWLAVEPEVERHFLADHGGFAWEGAVAGEGRVEVLEEDGPRSLRLRWTWLKPGKWQGDLGFKFRDLGGNQGVEVIWSITGGLPFGRIREPERVANLLGRDAGLGLRLLQICAAEGGAKWRLETPGRVLFPGGRYVGLKREVPEGEDPDDAAAAFGEVTAWLESRKTAALGPRTLLWSGGDGGKGGREVIAAFQVGSGTLKGKLPPGLVSIDVPGGKAELVRLIGPPACLPLARASVRARVEALGLERRLSLDLLQVEEKRADGAPVTAVYLPVK
ncbi:MAG: SRPBCC family protein [Verrucomicrobia bacterium]|nr:SRPBCC family protein [Verrucomicrobiota bacterium]